MLSTLVLSHFIQDQTVRLENLDLKNVVQEWGEPRAKRSVENNALTIGGKQYEHGVGTHSNGLMVIELHRKGLRFSADVGVDSETKEKGSVEFQVLGDGKLLWKSGTRKGSDPAVHVDVSIKGVRLLNLVSSDAGDGNSYDHADWADAAFSVKTGAQINTSPGPSDPAMKIAMDTPAKPMINGPRVIGCSPGKPFFFRVPITGAGPLTLSVTGLPDGLSYDSGTHVISGQVAAEGKYVAQIDVASSNGHARRDFTIVCGDHKLALTPPMGWNSWNVWGTSVTADKVRAAADSLDKAGLADSGYRYVNIDDAWEGTRDREGEIVPNEKFGDISALASYVHAKGLGLGIYSSPGEKTCAGYAGSFDHEVQDAQTYGKWGVDYLKYDWCSYGDKAPKDPTVADFQAPYRVMRKALDTSSRDIVYSLCQYGMGDVYNWGKEVGGNLWRTTGDINDSYSSMTGIAFQHDPKAVGVSPGGWNDPDMLVVGRLGWGDNPRPTNLKPNEQVMHITMWSMLSAPLILGCDLTRLDPWTKALITNHDVIDIDQDPLGKPARRLKADARGLEIWTRPLWDGTTAVAVMNRGAGHFRTNLRFSALHFKGAQQVYNVWERRSMGARRALSLHVPIHGAELFRIGRMK